MNIEQRRDEIYEDAREVLNKLEKEIYYDFNLRVALMGYAYKKAEFLNDMLEFLEFAKNQRTGEKDAEV